MAPCFYGTLCETPEAFSNLLRFSRYQRKLRIRPPCWRTWARCLAVFRPSLFQHAPAFGFRLSAFQHAPAYASACQHLSFLFVERLMARCA